MSKAVKVWLIVAGSITLLGCIILAGVMLFVNGDIIKMFTNRYETNKYDISEEFSSISLNTDTAEITFVLYAIWGMNFQLVQQGLALLSLIPIWLYRGNRGYHSKLLQYFYYAFYPLHLLILGLIKVVL